ncbi:hypothetical protein EVAR_56225_1 [Eumeta japonica]|uniref:Uncharacterized protein n=1 Tax=Eumeta variegata TaxID=151549 RepID=A0A4C1YY79_EUMVA|nr:hypothetical protein EVAR_56225_1 [Eumeta japonica]
MSAGRQKLRDHNGKFLSSVASCSCTTRKNAFYEIKSTVTDVPFTLFIGSATGRVVVPGRQKRPNKAPAAGAGAALVRKQGPRARALRGERRRKKPTEDG